MAEHNPYQPPAAGSDELDQAVGGPVLASRGARLVAAIVDSLVMMVFVLPMLYYLGAFDGFPAMTPLPPSKLALSGASGFALWVVINGWLLREYGQTVGKRLLGIRMVRASGEDASLARLVGLRRLPTSILSQIPVFGQFYALVDVLFIFGSSRRCLHDYIADTIVVEAAVHRD